jgi:adenylate cyclase
MGDGVNIAARLEGICDPGAICLSEDAYRQVRDRLDAAFNDLGDTELKNIARPVRAHSVALDANTKKSRPISPLESPPAGQAVSCLP